MITNTEAEVIDEEWIALITQAKELGLSIKEIREYLYQSDVKEYS